MIAWNSQMALDAGQYLFFNEASPDRIWEVTDSEGKEFVLKLYEIKDGMNSIKAGQYIESEYTSENESYEPNGTGEESEWAYVETSVQQVLNHYDEVDEMTDRVVES